MSPDAAKPLLKGVSRSFYLSLRLLPGGMRGPASLGYLLARTSDTLADSAAAPVAMRRECLAQFGHAVAGRQALADWPAALVTAIGDARERRLLAASGGLLGWLGTLPDAEAELLREVVATIIGGQRLDLERFEHAAQDRPVALENDAALEDYAWRVAGCVGAFWTRLGRLTLGEGFAAAPAAFMLDRGIAYGKGLQLVNILRDVPADLAAGRCYLPVADPQDRELVLDAHRRWLERAWEWVGEGLEYGAALRSRRMRAASVLPALLARETLQRMRGVEWAALQRRVKVPRAKVYLALARALGTTRG